MHPVWCTFLGEIMSTVHSNWLIYSAGLSNEDICQEIRREIEYQSRISGTRASIVVKVEAPGLHLESCLECLSVVDLGYRMTDWTQGYDHDQGIKVYELMFEPRGIPLDECQ